MWIVWLLLLLVAAMLAIWAALFVAVVIGGAVTHDLCPRCGCTLETTELDTSLDPLYMDPRHRSHSRDHCARCGWQRSEPPR